jgi:hypothetical protein
MADPQAQALHVDSNTVRTVQAAAMVGMCLAAGYIIAFGAGLIWPRGGVLRRTVRPGEVFVVFHYGYGSQSANQHTWYARDPISHQPQFKSSPVAVRQLSLGQAVVLARLAELNGEFGSTVNRAVQPVFDHPPTSLRDPDAPNQTPISRVVLRHCESGADQAGQRTACKAVGEHDRLAGTERTAGEQLERPTLLRVDATLSRGDIVIHSHSYDMCWRCAGLRSVNLQAPAGRHL